MCAAAKVSARYRHENAFDSSADLKIPHNDVHYDWARTTTTTTVT